MSFSLQVYRAFAIFLLKLPLRPPKACFQCVGHVAIIGPSSHPSESIHDSYGD